MNRIFNLFFFLTTGLMGAQTTELRLASTIYLPKDSIVTKSLISSLNSFLISAQKPNEENRYVLESQKIETFILLDVLNGITKSGKYKDPYFFKPYLTNVCPLKDHTFLIQVSYIGTKDTSAILRASFEFIATKMNNSFVFSSLLLRNTQHWKIEKSGGNIFHYQNTINEKKVFEFNTLTLAFDLKLKSTNKITEFYCCDNLIELEKLIGVDYKSDYNGMPESVWNSSLDNRKLIVLGDNNSEFRDFDPHDLWHDRLSLVIGRDKVNKPVDEGCAYLYGGSWGFTWKEIFNTFKQEVANNKNANWVEIKENPVLFKTKGLNNSADYIVNALLVKKIEREKGFAGVWELLNVGPYEKGNEKYYQELEKLIGITKLNYNNKVWELINNEN
jgi:hypothetical protein